LDAATRSAEFQEGAVMKKVTKQSRKTAARKAKHMMMSKVMPPSIRERVGVSYRTAKRLDPFLDYKSWRIRSYRTVDLSELTA
jgi:hypothetical protein